MSSHEYNLFYDVETNKPVVAIKDAKIDFEEAKTVANGHFRVSKNNLVACYAKITVNDDDVLMQYDGIEKEKANAVAVYIERR